jgi:hypothetical protein
MPQALFCAFLGLALVLLGLAGVAPFLDQPEAPSGVWLQLVAVFAHDAAVRKTALAGALGLVVTACVFFRPPRLTRRNKTKGPKLPPSQRVVGA